MAERGGDATRGSGAASGTGTRSPVLDGVRHVLFVHAHPDDETLATGALMAELVERGVTVTLVTCTRGERGEVVAGPHSHLAGTPEFAAHREQELAGALAELGVTRHVFLGMPPARDARREPRVYEDSGMRWVSEGLAGLAEDASPRALTSVSVTEEVADLVAFLDAFLSEAGATTGPGFASTPGPLTAGIPVPDLIVSYNEIGGYGHPDHVRAREVAQTTARTCGIRFAEIVDEASAVKQAQDAGEPATWFDLDHRLDHVTRAVGHHASQVTVDGDDVVHSGGQRTPIQTSAGLRVVS